MGKIIRPVGFSSTGDGQLAKKKENTEFKLTMLISITRETRKENCVLSLSPRENRRKKIGFNPFSAMYNYSQIFYYIVFAWFHFAPAW